ncbi:RES family NAD+ phosphorylase [Roseibium sp. RKSG952]|uniref:RES family NAD+ phosphorylase n=1 Tax=Roseibium sp. RKSG952 TaxID=2529384 RepID=UPI0012BD7856|nr:RES family NAD+ phosphorylase [Roseibium sp. RKSG952]MTH94791.1 RES domain-containing protein [Roseibium sp. RKSG952]
MSSHTWTPDALQYELSSFSGVAWRLVEAQHQVSTLKLVDSLEEQEILEDILDTTKPPMPDDCRHLDYLLSTPFRYRPYPHGSRFRRSGVTPGVWYGAEAVQTAVAEMVFYKFLFYAESPETPLPDNAAEYTAFSAAIGSSACLNLTTGVLSQDAVLWTHPTDYAACQSLADCARETGAEIIRYQSVRDPNLGNNVAVLSCRAFTRSEPVDRESWRIHLTRTGAQAVREHPRLGVEYPLRSFSGDPRLARYGQ